MPNSNQSTNRENSAPNQTTNHGVPLQSCPSEFPLPVTSQPVIEEVPSNVIDWASSPTSNCPPGFEYLANLDQVLMDIEVTGVTGRRVITKFHIKNHLGQEIYHTVEQCYADVTAGDEKIVDDNGREVIRTHRLVTCELCSCFCAQRMEVFSPPETLLAIIHEEWGICSSTFNIKNGNSEIMLRLEGPCCPVSCFTDVNFRIMSANRQRQLGEIVKKWAGCLSDFMGTCQYRLSFPLDLNVEMKAALVGASILINFMYFDCRL